MQHPNQGILKKLFLSERKFYRSRGRQSAPCHFNTPLTAAWTRLASEIWSRNSVLDKLMLETLWCWVSWIVNQKMIKFRKGNDDETQIYLQNNDRITRTFQFELAWSSRETNFSIELMLVIVHYTILYCFIRSIGNEKSRIVMYASWCSLEWILRVGWRCFANGRELSTTWSQ